MSYKYVSLSWQLVRLLSCTTLTLLFLSLQTLMSILFLRLINSSLLYMLTSLRQWLFSLCSVTMFCLYKLISHCSRWELISCHTLTQFWFRVRMCWFLTVVLTVRNTVWCLFWNVVVHQNISVNVAATVSDVIMLLTALYATMMYLLSSQTMRTTTVLMRMSALLSWGKLHWPHCWQRQSLLTSTFKYIWLLFLFLCCL